MEINQRLEKISQYAYSTLSTVQHTYKMALEMKSIDGCFVECGVGAGAQLMAMALARTGKDIIGFDSFEGIPLASEHDDQQPGIGAIDEIAISRLVSSGVAVHSMESVLANFTTLEIGCPTLRLKKGWFQNTLPKFQPVPIALLRLDGDLYESTLVCLQYLYPLVSVGGVVIADDMGLPGAAKAVYEYFGDKMPELLPVEGSWGVKYFYKISNNE